MNSLESKLPQFYDIMDEETETTYFLFDLFRCIFKKNGYLNIETTSMEQRTPYLNATKIHFSKIFEVHRSKKGGTYVLQSDLALSMSRMISDMNTTEIMKLFQIGKIYRDRVDNKPGYRREFKQILSGVWGSKNYYYDVEVITLNYTFLKKIDQLDILYIQISNYNIFNAIQSNLVEKIRFSGIELLENTNITKKDKEILKVLFNKKEMDIQFLKHISVDIDNTDVKKEINNVLHIYSLLENSLPDANIVFSLNNLEGSGHYSGFNYRIYASINKTKFLIGDGGRIDNMCASFNKNYPIPGVCMGIGIQVISQLISPPKEKKIIILENENNIDTDYQNTQKIRQHFIEDYQVNTIILPEKKWKKIFNSKLNKDSIFILLKNEKVEVRGNDKILVEQVKKQLMFC